ncbi:TetR/AcrR family transcriptional regulator [Allokutzneria sp. NRRL B-24872]|uniref:TetR/AcrR family transcriptional regulator n=1 Tax=Allokutzneria sp. NRRL B-24872 TaxID=1137961 RepID=UPI000A3A11AC|nr:TetR/AcrR family transcriptional regulator [Allokutzneria sp. NRRL B-24872]
MSSITEPAAEIPAGRPRGRMTRDARRAQLLELATELIIERGVDGFSTNELARRAGISNPLLFHYFPTRGDIVLEVVSATIEDLVERVRPNPELSPIDQLTEGLSRYVGYVERTRNGYLSLVRGAAAADADLRAVVDSSRTRIAGYFTDSLTAAGIEVDAALSLLVRGAVAFVEEIALHWVSGPQLDREDLVELLRDSLLRALPFSAEQLEALTTT